MPFGERANHLGAGSDRRIGPTGTQGTPCWGGDDSFIEKADNAMAGKIFAFSHEYLDYAVDGRINWHLNPVSGVEASSDTPWNRLADFGELTSETPQNKWSRQSKVRFSN